MIAMPKVVAATNPKAFPRLGRAASCDAETAIPPVLIGSMRTCSSVSAAGRTAHEA